MASAYGELLGKRQSKDAPQNANRNLAINNLNINILDTYDDHKIYSKLMDEENAFDKILIHKFKEGKHEEANLLIEKFILEISKKLYNDKQKISKTIFEKLQIEISEEKNNKLHYVKYGFFDLIFQNCYLD